jgi:predicted permease
MPEPGEHGNHGGADDMKFPLWTWLEQLGQDVRYALRTLRKSPGFTVVAVLSLGLGIGANTAIFGLIYSVLLAKLPLPHAEQLVLFQRVADRASQGPQASYGEYVALRGIPGLSGTGASFSMDAVPIEVGDARDEARVDLVDGSYFGVVGVRPVRGRTLTEDDQRTGAPVVVISETIWDRQFHRSPDVLNRTLKIQGMPFTVIGVLPRQYNGLDVPGQFDVAVPMSTAGTLGWADPATQAASTNGIPTSVSVVARLTDVEKADAARAALDATYQRCCAAGQLLYHPKGPMGLWRMTLRDISHGIVSQELDLRAMFAQTLFLLMGGVAVVLLIACANVGSLLLARAAARARELGVRLSLGASRGRLARQLLTESLLLAMLGAAVGLALAALGTRILAHDLPSAFAAVAERVQFALNVPILLFTGAVAIASVVLFGMVPAWQATRVALVAPLTRGSRASICSVAGGLDRGLIVAQVAFALVLVSASGLFVATLRNLRNVDVGFAATHFLGAFLSTYGTPYQMGGMRALEQRVTERLRGTAGVKAAAVSRTAPVFGGRLSPMPMVVSGYAPQPGETVAVVDNIVSPDYFPAAGIPVISGRGFLASDDIAAPRVAIVSEGFVKRYFVGREALGATIQFPGLYGPEVRIVGVVGDAKYQDLKSPAPPMLYRAMRQFTATFPYVTLLVRTAGDPGPAAATVRAAITAVAPGLRIENVVTIDDALNRSLIRERLTAALAALFGAIALGLTAVGLYGVVSYAVARRTGEIGIRMALGAQRSSVVWLVFRQSLLLVALGVAIGLPMAVAGGRVIASQLWGVGAHDPLFLAGSVFLLVAAACAASTIPARRAARVDPSIALRAE